MAENLTAPVAEFGLFDTSGRRPGGGPGVVRSRVEREVAPSRTRSALASRINSVSCALSQQHLILA